MSDALSDSPASIELDGRAWLAVRRNTVLLVLLGMASSACWFVLVRWYSLHQHRSHTHFAFEKVPGYFSSPILRGTLLLFVALALLYLAGYLLIRRNPLTSNMTRFGIMLFILGPGIGSIFIYPVGALDVFNYLIELKLAFHFDQNPYLVTFAAYRDDPFALPAFLVNVPLFYGPAWLLISGLPAAVAGFSDVVQLLLALKVWNLALLVLTAVAIARYQDNLRQGLLATYLFLANPLVLFEGVSNAHNDVLMTFFLIAALLALQRRSVLAGPLLVLSVLVKFFTAAMAPLFVLAALKEKWSKGKIVASVLLTVVVMGLVVMPYWAGGDMVAGLQRGTAMSQRMDHASVVSLAQQYAVQVRVVGDEQPWFSVLTQRLPYERALTDREKAPLQRVFTGLFAVLALIITWGVVRGRAFEAAVVDTLMLFALLMTNLYPWYLIPIIAVLALRPNRLHLVYLFAATGLGLVYYPMYVFAHFDMDWPKLQAHLFLALFVTLPMLTFLAAQLGGAGLRAGTACRRGMRRGWTQWVDASDPAEPVA